MAIKFAIRLPAPPENPDDWAEIDHGELTVQIGSGDTIEIIVDKEEQEEGDRLVLDSRFIGPQDTEVSMEYVYVDDAGNKGTSVFNTQTLIDSVPPVAPTGIGLVATEEVPDDV